ncbi:MAG: membrane protein insertase YidC [Bacteroidetes bacterium]|nr:membrane protein insertase YidC [Bacteroidota bacterium]
MNKNTIIGFLLMMTIVFGFSWYSQKQMSQQIAIQQRADSINKANDALIKVSIDSIKTNNIASIGKAVEQEIQEDDLASSFKGEVEKYTIENDKMVITLSNAGGAIKSVQLKEYKTNAGLPLMLFNEENSEFNIAFFTNKSVNTYQHFFEVSENTPNKISLRLYADSTDSYIQYNYTLAEGSYKVDFNVSFHNMESVLNPSQTNLSLKWANVSPQQERGFDFENQYTNLGYKYLNDNEAETKSMSKEGSSEELESKVEWVAFKQQFFSSIIISEDGFLNGDVSSETMTPESGFIKSFETNLSLPYTPSTKEYNLAFYFGPNDYKIMKSYDKSFEDLIPLGWSVLRWITIGLIIPLFNILGSFISNYGIIIIILTFIIKLIIFPFTYKSYVSMAKMRLLKPEIEIINEKYKKSSEAAKKQQATMELYKKAGANPMGGCLPMLFQFPIIIAMFRFFPASIELRQQSFLWASDLSSYDSIFQIPFNIPFYGDHVSLFTLLMAISMYFSARINMKNNASASGPQMPMMNAMMLYVMPLMLLVWFNNYSSGLCLYYLLSNMITIIQTVLIRRTVNDEKLHARMRENAKKPMKKSAFQKRLDDMTKQQQAKMNNKK